MKTTDLFKVNRSSKRLNESLEKMFGQKLNLESFDLPRLEDARNKLRTQVSQVRNESGFNETVENEALTKAQWMLDAINAEIAERQEFIADPHTATVEYDETSNEGFSSEVDEFFHKVAQAGDWDMLYDAQSGKYGPEIEKAVQDMYEAVAIDTGYHMDDDFEEIYSRMMDDIEKDYGDSDADEPHGSYDSSDDADALASAGFGSDEDYGYHGHDEGVETEGGEFGAYYYEQLAQKVFDENPNLSTKGRADEVMNAGWKFAVQDLGKKRAQWEFNYDEDFPSDFVSAYGWLQKEHSQEESLNDDVDYSEDDEGNGVWTYKGHTLTLQGDYAQGEMFIDKKFVGQYETSDSGTRKVYDANMKPLFTCSVDDEKKIGEFLKSKFSESVDIEEKAPPTAKGERMVKHIKKGYAKDGKLTDKEKSIAYATAWKQHNKENNESIEQTGDDMRNLREGEIQQASAIVTAKTMVDRVGRWIEELSGMENDTLLQLGDSIRDEMGAEQAKNFISQCAPAIQQALQNLKDTRETLSNGVRGLTGEEQAAGMLGGEPGSDMGGDEFGASEPDMMNAGSDEFGAAPEDEFAASDAGAGGLETAGREQRESVEYGNRLLKVLAG